MKRFIVVALIFLSTITFAHFCVKDTIFSQLMMARVFENSADNTIFNGVFYLTAIMLSWLLTLLVAEKNGCKIN